MDHPKKASLEKLSFFSLSFDDFLQDLTVQKHSLNTNLQNFLQDSEGFLLVDKVIPVENLESGLQAVFSKLDIPWKGILRTNHAKTDRPHYSAWYSDTGRRLVAELHLADIRQGAYKFLADVAA